MGTSNSGGGPGDKTPLLPDWALPRHVDGGDGGDAGAEGGSEGGADHGDLGEGDGGDNEDSGTAGETGGEEGGAVDPTAAIVAPSQRPPAARRPAYWATAKSRLASVASGGHTRAGIARAGRAYVRARGGSRAASHSATSARGATARLGGFLSLVASQGVRPALESLGLGRLVGSEAHLVFAAIIDSLAPEGSDLEQAATREAIGQTLAGLFEEYVAPDGSVAALEAMTPDGIRAAVEASVAASIFHRWLGDLERRLEEKAVTAAQAVKLERDMESYVRETVKLDLTDKDPLKIKWEGEEGAAFVERIYQEAYSILAEMQ